MQFDQAPDVQTSSAGRLASTSDGLRHKEGCDYDEEVVVPLFLIQHPRHCHQPAVEFQTHNIAAVIFIESLERTINIQHNTESTFDATFNRLPDEDNASHNL